MIVRQQIYLLRSLVDAKSTFVREMSKQKSKRKGKADESKLKTPEVSEMKKILMIDLTVGQ